MWRKSTARDFKEASKKDFRWPLICENLSVERWFLISTVTWGWKQFAVNTSNEKQVSTQNSQIKSDNWKKVDNAVVKLHLLRVKSSRTDLEWHSILHCPETLWSSWENVLLNGRFRPTYISITLIWLQSIITQNYTSVNMQGIALRTGKWHGGIQRSRKAICFLEISCSLGTITVQTIGESAQFEGGTGNMPQWIQISQEIDQGQDDIFAVLLGIHRKRQDAFWLSSLPQRQVSMSILALKENRRGWYGLKIPILPSRWSLSYDFAWQTKNRKRYSKRSNRQLNSFRKKSRCHSPGYQEPIYDFSVWESVI